MLSGLNMSQSIYNNIIREWSKLSLTSGVTFDVRPTTYLFEVFDDRNTILNKGWTLLDGGASDFVSMKIMYEVNDINNKTVTLPLYGTVAVNVAWGDNSSSYYNTTGNKDHTYSSIGTYTIEIVGVLTQFGNGVSGYINADKIKSIITFGDVQIESLAGAFKDAINFTSVPNQIPSTLTSLEYTFYGATQFNDSNVLSWNTTNLTNTDYTFFNATSFNQDIYQWETPNLIDNHFMLFGASSFSQPISGWLLNKILNFLN